MVLISANTVNVYVNLKGRSSTRSSCRNSFCPYSSRQQLQQNWSQDSNSPIIGSRRLTTGLRKSNAERSLLNKRRVIKMLFAVVLEFFICWTPLYVINTIALFDSTVVYKSIGYTGISFFQLLAYTSSCCNPITYCFMNFGFRKSFLNMFKCSKRFKSSGMTGSEINMETKWTNRLSEPA
uniref:Cholecystokinin receptor-like n=1 Tax=Diabrotica virgifera virgifera TaxID=50390 RepID=A0A6P7GTS4_DIAVI